MKCKKIFALMLSLCMVLSTFVAVSAQEQVYVPGTPTRTDLYVDVDENFDNGLGTTLEGDRTKNALSVGAAPAGAVVGDNANPSGQVLIMDSNETAGSWQGVAGWAMKNEDGIQYTAATMPKAGTVHYSFDVMVNDATTCNPSLSFRCAASFPPSGNNVNIKNAWGLQSNTWKHIEGTIAAPALYDSTTSRNVYLVIRPSFSSADGMLYIDNLKFSVKDTNYVEYVVDQNEDFETSMGDAKVGSNGNAVISGALVTEGGRNVLKATATAGTSHTEVIGIPVKNTSGAQISLSSLDPDAYLAWSMDVMTKTAYNGGGYIGFRNGGWTPSSGEVANLQTLSASSFSNGVWKTFSGITRVGDLGGNIMNNTGNSYLIMRNNFSGAAEIYVDNISLQVFEIIPEGEATQPSWVAADYNIPFTAAKNGNMGTLDASGEFTITLKELQEYATASGHDYGWIDLNTYVKLANGIPAGKDFILTYDFKVNGYINSQGNPYSTMDAVTRFYDAAGNELKIGGTNAYRPQVSLAANTDNTVKFTQYVDADQLAGAPASVRIGFRLSTLQYHDYSASDAAISISNIELKDAGLKLGMTAEKTANGAEVTLTNDSENDVYKFSGRVLIAEYKDVDGVNELVQFAEVNALEEVAAGSSETVTAAFRNNVTAGNSVYVFVWEPGSMEPITMFIK